MYVSMACSTVARSGGSAGIDVDFRHTLYTRAGFGPAKFRSIESAICFGETCAMNPTMATRRNVMRWSVAAVVAALGRSPLALAGDDADPDADVIPFLDPQPYDPKRPMLNWDE